MATLTPNLKLTKPDLEDNISPIPMSENMDIIDSAVGELKKDYVVSQGVQGQWIYRRWASGLAEAWLETTGATGGWKWWSQQADWLQYAGNGIQVPYPMTFKNVPMEFASAKCTTTDCWVDRQGSSQSTTMSSIYYLTTQGDGIKPAGWYTFNLYVVGRWK